MFVETIQRASNLLNTPLHSGSSGLELDDTLVQDAMEPLSLWLWEGTQIDYDDPYYSRIRETYRKGIDRLFERLPAPEWGG